MPRQGKYDPATRERAVRMYIELLEEGGTSKTAARPEIGQLLDVKETTMQNWIRTHQKQEDTPSDAKPSYAELEKAYGAERQRNQRLEKANEILKTTPAFSPRLKLDRKLRSRGLHPHLRAARRGRGCPLKGGQPQQRSDRVVFGCCQPRRMRPVLMRYRRWDAASWLLPVVERGLGQPGQGQRIVLGNPRPHQGGQQIVFECHTSVVGLLLGSSQADASSSESPPCCLCMTVIAFPNASAAVRMRSRSAVA